MKIFLLAGALIFIYILIYRPQYAAVILFTLAISGVNFDVPGLPLNIRALISLALFVRVIVQKNVSFPPLFSSPVSLYVLLFLLYVAFISMGYNLLDFDLVKEFVLTYLAVYLGYHFYFTENGLWCIKVSLILAGFICLADLLYTYAVLGGFPVQRIYQVVLGTANPEQPVNHNFFGYICGLTFVFLLHDFLNSKSSVRLSVILLMCMFFGVLMSTSRSSLMSMIIVAVFLIWRALRSKEGGKKAYNFVMITLGCFFLSLFLFQIFQSVFGLSNEFFDFITNRLIDEPLAAINKALGYNYKIQDMDSVEWREEASSLAYTVFQNLKPVEQIFGIGYGGFMIRDYGRGFDAHNGLLLLLIETGIVGFLIYFGIIVSIIMRTRSLKLFSPVFSCLLFIILFAVTHNKELTSFPAFLIIGTLIAEIQKARTKQRIQSATTDLAMARS